MPPKQMPLLAQQPAQFAGEQVETVPPPPPPFPPPVMPPPLPPPVTPPPPPLLPPVPPPEPPPLPPPEVFWMTHWPKVHAWVLAHGWHCAPPEPHAALEAPIWHWPLG